MKHRPMVRGEAAVLRLDVDAWSLHGCSPAKIGRSEECSMAPYLIEIGSYAMLVLRAQESRESQESG
jgi:hypothetical protein